jgi:hypothetical protein
MRQLYIRLAIIMVLAIIAAVIAFSVFVVLFD